MDDDSVVDFLKSQGRDSSFQARRILAASYGISGYTGTGPQNIELLAYLRAGTSGRTLLQRIAGWFMRIFRL